MLTLPNKWYDRIKWTITVFLPALGAFYFVLAEAWDFPRVPGVNGTINGLIAFLGVLLNYSSKQYNKTVAAPDGDLIINEVDGEKFPALGVNVSLENMVAKDTVKLNVVDNTGVPVSDMLPEPPPK